MSDDVFATVSEFAALRARVNALENLLRDYLLKERETAIMTMSQIEDGLRLPRTKEKRIRNGGD